MELLIVIAPILIAGVIGYIVVSIQEWIIDMRFYRRRTQRELDRIRRSHGKATLPTGEIETYELDVTENVSSSLIEEMSEAEKLIKEAKEKKV